MLRLVAFRAGPPARVPVLLGTCRACFLCGRSGSGPDPGRARALHGPVPAHAAGPGHLGVSTVDLGGCGAFRPWAPPALFPPCRVTHCLRVCLHCDCRRAARACLWTGAGGRDDASTPSGAARWEPHGAAPLCCAGAQAPFAPSSALARTGSGLSASSPAGAASVNEFSCFGALVLASSVALDAPASRGSGAPLPSPSLE